MELRYSVVAVVVTDVIIIPSPSRRLQIMEVCMCFTIQTKAGSVAKAKLGSSFTQKSNILTGILFDANTLLLSMYSC